MTEKDKMLAGAMYDPFDPELVSERHTARQLFQKINAMNEDAKDTRDRIVKKLLPNAGAKLIIEPPFFCDYGYNIHTGDKVFFNFNCCILDVMPVVIGDRCMFGPFVQIYTATHPLEAELRNSGREFAKPVTIGNNVWVGGNAVICPGVSIGDNAVIGAGAVVTKDVPKNTLVGGSPARIIKTIAT